MLINVRFQKLLFVFVMRSVRREEVRTGRPQEKDNLEVLDLDGRTIFKLVFRKYDGKAWTGLMCSCF